MHLTVFATPASTKMEQVPAQIVAAALRQLDQLQWTTVSVTLDTIPAQTNVPAAAQRQRQRAQVRQLQLTVSVNQGTTLAGATAKAAPRTQRAMKVRRTCQIVFAGNSE